MKVSKISITNFMVHDQSTLDLPATGLVVLSGGNAQGKSTWIEAVAFGAWGETLRGTSPWRSGVGGRVALTTDLGRVTRSVNEAGKKGATWAPRGVAPRGVAALVTADTPTKTEAMLAHSFGAMDVWRRTHVFSSADAAHFTLATDSQRKQLVEQMLGLERFDVASTSIRTELRTAGAALTEARARQRQCQMQVDNVQQRLADDAPPELHLPCAPPPFRDDTHAELLLAELHDVVFEATQALARVQLLVPAEPDRVLLRELSDHQIAKRDADQAAALASAGQCTACGAPFTGDVARTFTAQGAIADTLMFVEDAVRRDARTVLETNRRQDAAQAAARQCLRAAEAERAAQRVVVATLVAQRAAAASADARHASEVAAAQIRFGILHEAWTTRFATLHELLATHTEAHSVATSDVVAAFAAHAELEVADRVLGLKGVRVAVLAHALQATESLANLWLAQMDTALKVKINPFTVLKGGGMNQSISIEVEGAGGGHGYRASSGGERRRIDAALLLAFAEVSEASAGRSGGTLFIDEVFDAIDPAGCAGVAAVLAEIAEVRCLVVVTHRQELAWMLRQAGATEYRAENGVIKQIGGVSGY